MNNFEFEPENIRDKETVLQTLVEGSDKNDLAHCVRMISLCMTMYKKHFGELSEEVYAELMEGSGISGESDDIFETSLNEAIAMLNMIVHTSPTASQYDNENVTIN
jgi:hypothetical protein